MGRVTAASVPRGEANEGDDSGAFPRCRVAVSAQMGKEIWVRHVNYL
jgi:hypothetical protein